MQKKEGSKKYTAIVDINTHKCSLMVGAKFKTNKLNTKKNFVFEQKQRVIET